MGSRSLSVLNTVAALAVLCRFVVHTLRSSHLCTRTRDSENMTPIPTLTGLTFSTGRP